MDFSDALRLIKDGKKLIRSRWKDSFIFLIPTSENEEHMEKRYYIYPLDVRVKEQQHIGIRMSDGFVYPWSPQQFDLMADDWMEMRHG